ncbi:MAG: helix-turn-helix domain-containing protein [Proteobacteria bacterium]|nr:helix-turn-helix domain-containing protein [Pseudomonadota bacterium]MCP4920240.1 helix-turn-helix domain-containing protein [Pseudomonadota bacterium]
MRDDPANNLARSIRQLREIRGYTQNKLAQLSGVPRPTIANLESGGANPTLSVLTKVAAALQVSIEELISPPRAVARLYKASELRVKRRGDVTVRQLLPDAIPGVVVERMELLRDATMAGVPHKPGTREYLTCETGRLLLTASGEKYRLEPGDVVVFRGDQKHGYANAGETTAVAYSVVMPAS